MNPLTLEWIEKAEGDMVTAQREFRARNRPNFDAACFHAQQTAEKYLKAYLQGSGKDITNIHHLVELGSLCLEIDGKFQIIEAELRALDGYTASTRYPGHSAIRDEALDAIAISKGIRRFIRKKFGLE